MCTKTLSCPLCCQSNFPNIDALRLSLIKVTSRPLKCPICDDVLLGLDKLTIHLFGHSVLQDEDDVKDNQKTEKLENEKNQMNGDADANEEAEKKKVLESLKSARKNHRKSEAVKTTTKTVTSTTVASIPQTAPIPQQSIVYKFKCEFCGFLFDNDELLTMHVTLFHPQAARSATNQDECDLKEKFPCHLCSKSFKMKGSLKIHIRVVHPNAKPVKIETFSNPNSPSQQNPKSPASPCNKRNTPISSPQHQPAGIDSSLKMWECDICAKSFTTKYFLKKHKRLHTGEMPYACNICGKTFTFQQSYHKHLLYHSDEKPHVCSICKRAFKELSTLHNHERIHSGEKPFKCENCGKCFRQRVSYLVHKRIHTGVMPYKCTACDKSFRYKVSQRTHKCTAQPPGTVVRQTDLLQKLLQSSSILPITEGEDLKADETDLINKSLDDFVKESYAKMALEIDNSPFNSCNSNDNIPHIENLCLLSPSTRELMSFDSGLDTIESLKLDLLYDNVNNMQL